MRRPGRTEQVTLSLGASLTAKLVKLSDGLDPLGGGRYLKCAAQPGNCTNNGNGLGLFLQIMNKKIGRS